MTSRQIFCTTWNFDIKRCFRSFAIISLISLTRSSSIKSRKLFFSFSTLFNCLRVCKIESSRSSSIFFHKEFSSSSIIVILCISNRVSRIVWWMSCAILNKCVSIRWCSRCIEIVSSDLSLVFNAIFQLSSFSDVDVDSVFDAFQLLDMIYLVR